MKFLLKVSLSIIVSIVFSACGGSDSTSVSIVNNSTYGTNERMILNKSYTIDKGDEIEKLSDNTKLELSSNLETGKTEVKLISGEASIIRY